jgi:hypothetical protein
MDLSTTQQVLLIILGAALAVFLILAIAAMIMVIRLLLIVRAVTSKAERLIQSGETAIDMIKNVTGPAGLFNVIKSAYTMVQHHKRNKE